MKRPGKCSKGRIVAGIDIGTLTCRLLIAEYSVDNGLEELSSDRRILRLGEGVDRNRRLQPAAMDRVLSALQEWRQQMSEYGVERCVVVATSAVRDAANRKEFLARIKDEAGLEVEVIAGEEEARRTLLGIRSGLPKEVDDMLAIDIGGGSTEFILDRPPAPPLLRSVELGVVRTTEGFFRSDPPTDREVKAAWSDADAQTRAALQGMDGLDTVAFVGTAGTITSLAAMAQGLSVYNTARIHNYRLKLEEVEQLEAALRARTRAERREIPGLEPGREEVIVAGALILRTVMIQVGRREIVVSDYGLREGVVLDLCHKALWN